MHSDLHARRLAALDAGKAYHASGTQYFGAVSGRYSEAEINQALEQCIISGEQYRTALEMYLAELQNLGTNDEVAEAIESTQRLLDLLGLELRKLVALRAKRRF